MNGLLSQVESVDQSNLRFATELPLWQVITLATLSVVVVAWLYLRQTSHLNPVIRSCLVGLRSLAVLLAVAMLAQPIWHSREVIGTLGRVVFAIDVSGSMSVNDASSASDQPARWKRALDVLQGSVDGPAVEGGRTTRSDRERSLGSSGRSSDGWLEQLSQSHEIDIVAFDDEQAQLIWSSMSDDPSNRKTRSLDSEVARWVGGDTDLSTPLLPMLSLRKGDKELREVESSVDDGSSAAGTEPATNANGPTKFTADWRPLSDQRAAVVLFSDGRDTGSGSARDIAGQLNLTDIQVFTVGMGTEQEPVDIGIIDVDCPTTVASDGQLAGRLNVKTVSPRGTVLLVQLRIRKKAAPLGELVWQTRLTANGDVSQVVPFQFDVEPWIASRVPQSNEFRGRDSTILELDASVESQVQEDTIAVNDSIPFRVTVNDRDRNLLVLDGSSRWETRYVRNLFDRDPAWNVTTLLYGPGTDRDSIQRGDQPGQLPLDREDWSKYDAIILGEIPPEQWTEQDTFRLKEFVTRGGGLIVVDGRLGRIGQLRELDLADLLPIRHASSQDAAVPQSPSERSVRSAAPLIRNLVKLAPTQLARNMPLFNVAVNQSDSTVLWSLLPPMTALNDIEPSTDAETWAEAVDGSGNRFPWMVTKLFGGGRVIYLASDETWRWRYKVADRFHTRFWNQLVGAVIPTSYAVNDEFIALGTDLVEYESGQSPLISVRLRSADGKPAGSSTVDAVLSRDGVTQQVVPLTVVDASRGTYQGLADGLLPGKHDISIQASGFSQEALSATTSIWVEDRTSQEWSRLSLDESTQRAIADAGGGLYVHESFVDRLIPELRPISSGTVIESDHAIWNAWPWFVALLLLLTAEWILRKRVGLI